MRRITHLSLTLVGVGMFLLITAGGANAALIVGGSTLNGNFTAGTGDGTRAFADTNDWVNIGTDGNQALEATRTNLAHPGDGRNAVIAGTATRSFGLDTGYTLSAGDVFDVAYDWRDAFNWGTGKQIQVTLFVTDDDLIGGNRTDLFFVLSGPEEHDEEWESVDNDAFYTAVAANAGQRLFVEVDNNTGTSGFARLDNFVLEVTAIPEPSALLMAGVALVGLSLFRRRK